MGPLPLYTACPLESLVVMDRDRAGTLGGGNGEDIRGGGRRGTDTSARELKTKEEQEREI